MAENSTNDHGTEIPKHEIESLARCLLPEIQKFFESEQGKREFSEWEKTRGSKTKEDKKPKRDKVVNAGE